MRSLLLLFYSPNSSYDNRAEILLSTFYNGLFQLFCHHRIFLNIYVFLRTMHRIRPQKLQNNCEKSGIIIQINTKNMRNSFKNTKKRGFLLLFSNAQNINNYILLNCLISCIFSEFYKICLYYLCYERLHYLSEKVKERKNGFSQNYQQNLALGALKCVSDGIFYPRRRVKILG